MPRRKGFISQSESGLFSVRRCSAFQVSCSHRVSRFWCFDFCSCFKPFGLFRQLWVRLADVALKRLRVFHLSSIIGHGLLHNFLDPLLADTLCQELRVIVDVQHLKSTIPPSETLHARNAAQGAETPSLPGPFQ